MLYTYPHYYRKFQCIASECEDTCCAGWEIMIDDKALEKYRRSHKPGSFTLQRYKGLGEMDAQQLWETTLNPETRRMKRVEIEDARMASSVTEILMGSDVPPRKAFIYEHATDAELDI